MQRFFVPNGTITGDAATLTGDTARQISRVLRMQPGSQVCLLDGLGYEYLVRLDSFGKDFITGAVVEKKEGDGEPAHTVTLYISLLNKAEKFEWALQKCTEIGAAHFTPVQATRSVPDKPGAGRKERWERIIQEAAEQSGRAVLPTLGESMTFAAALSYEAKRIGTNHSAMLPTLGATASPASVVAGSSAATVSIFIGPEGGFTPEEVTMAEQSGLTPVTLGARTLRAETAAVVSLTLALNALGDMD